MSHPSSLSPHRTQMAPLESMQKYATALEIEAALKEAARSNPGKWIDHSQYVGIACRNIAARCADLNSEKAFSLGALHDIGRYVGIVRGRHQIEGYRYCMKEGWGANARVCLTHSQVLKDISRSLDYWDITDEEYDHFKEFIATSEFDDYDLLVQLADCLALANGFCILEKRMIDVARRYGTDQDSVARWNRLFELKDYFNQKTNCNIYTLLPGIEKNTLI